MPNKIDSVVLTWDWADANEAGKQIQKMLPKLGLFIYPDPDCEGSDQYGFIVSKHELTSQEIKKLSDIRHERED